MKIIYLLLFLFSSMVVCGQTTVTVDASNVLKKLTGKENGINLDYLMDGSYLSPAVSTTQALKNIHAKLLRYPGGEKSDNYLFSVALTTNRTNSPILFGSSHLATITRSCSLSTTIKLPPNPSAAYIFFEIFPNLLSSFIHHINP